MNIKRILIIEDNNTKYIGVSMYLKKYDFDTIDWARNASDAIEQLEDAIQHKAPYDLIISDMHFDFFGTDDHSAGEKTLKLIREKGYTTPVIFGHHKYNINS